MEVLGQVRFQARHATACGPNLRSGLSKAYVLRYDNGL
jgi:hypothetical protein